jgi:heat shock protein HslJ
MKSLAAIVLFSSIILFGCRLFQKAGSDTSSAYDPIIYSEIFLLESINGVQMAMDMFSGNHPSLSFHPEENKISGFAGCNRYFGSFEIADDSISIGIIGATKMACKHLDLEQKFLSGIGEQKFGWSIEDEKLLLRNENNVVIFRK